MQTVLAACFTALQEINSLPLQHATQHCENYSLVIDKFSGFFGVQRLTRLHKDAWGKAVITAHAADRQPGWYVHSHVSEVRAALKQMEQELTGHVSS